MKMYISGVMTPAEVCKEKFKSAETELVKKGYEVVNPMKVVGTMPNGMSSEETAKLTECLFAMCDSVYFLSGWEESEIACAELKRAEEEKKKIYFQNAGWKDRMLRTFMTR